MYNNVFQEYINNMIGGTPRIESIFENSAMLTANPYISFQSQSNMDLERSYPELYRLLYPMVKTACMRNTRPITNETIDQMVRDIYSSFNNDETTQVSAETRTKGEEADRAQRPNNFVLNDLIRILLIRELLGRPGNMY